MEKKIGFCGKQNKKGQNREESKIISKSLAQETDQSISDRPKETR